MLINYRINPFCEYRNDMLTQLYNQMIISKISPKEKEEYKEWTSVFETYYQNNSFYSDCDMSVKYIMENELLLEIARRFNNLYQSDILSEEWFGCDLEHISRNYKSLATVGE